MKLGVVFPQTELGPDPAVVREYAQAVEEMGYAHLVIFDHVVGADPAQHEGYRGPYDHKSQFHEPFVLFGYLAALTKRLELVTSIVILPQRQTVLVAKQAAEVDVLTGGRLRLGIGTGWNTIEYEALGQDFHTRGRRSEEQIALMRALWTQEVVTFKGRWDKVTAAGINPLPVQRPIPIWLGGRAEPLLKRVGRLGDGWFPQMPPTEEVQQMLERMRGYAQEAGRDPAKIGVEARIGVQDSIPQDWAKTAADWQKLGATHLSVNTMRAGFTSLKQHLDALRRFHNAVK
ncbi:MAG: LLM class F420-dependent oxidoreductase [Dehalococcoidia bacterium]|nr:LLM class F420-dependent oxidoreductase [Dehalococcoidia bacterium]